VEGLDGVFTSNEPTTIGALIALEKVKRSDIIHVGFYVSKQILAGVESGKIHAVISQRPGEMGYLGVVGLAAMLSHSAYLEFVDTGVFLSLNKTLMIQTFRQGWLLELSPVEYSLFPKA